MAPAADMSKAQRKQLATNRANWDRVAKSSKGRTALPRYGPLCQTEDELGLLGDLRGTAIIELGCGDGQSLCYAHERGARRLCGIDISSEQIANARRALDAQGATAELFCSPMEDRPTIEGGFDLAISLYALGWAIDLERSVANAFDYLRPGGVFVFSWEHPVFSCLRSEGKRVYVDRSYHEEGPRERVSWNGQPIVMPARKIDTFVRALLAAGFALEALIESPLRDDDGDYPRRWYSKDRASLIPTTLIIKARRPGPEHPRGEQ